jgi:hypothetical protein
VTAGTQEDCHAVIPLRYVTESIVPEMPQWSQGAERLSHAPPKAFKKSQYQRRSVPWRTARPAANGCRVREPRSVAKALLTDRSTVTKIETGARPPNDKLLALWLDACGVAGQFRTVLEGLGVLARAKEDSALLKVAPWFETEAKAHTLRYWAPVIVPGLVQTETYARELFAAMAFDDAKVTEFLEVRMGRQAIIDRPEPPDITIVLWEPVLHHQIGSRTVMREQLGHLMDMSTDRPLRFTSCHPAWEPTPDSEARLT